MTSAQVRFLLIFAFFPVVPVQLCPVFLFLSVPFLAVSSSQICGLTCLSTRINQLFDTFEAILLSFDGGSLDLGSKAVEETLIRNYVSTRLQVSNRVH